MRKWEREKGDFCTLNILTKFYSCLCEFVPAAPVMFTRTLKSSVRLGEHLNCSSVIAVVWNLLLH